MYYLRTELYTPLYFSALTFTNHFDRETKTMLEGVMKSAMLSSTTNMSTIIVNARINLSLVLQQMNVEPEKQKEYV